MSTFTQTFILQFPVSCPPLPRLSSSSSMFYVHLYQTFILHFSCFRATKKYMSNIFIAW
jgi:hypothetical protein